MTGDFNMNDYLQGKLGKQTSISEINLNDDIGQLARIGYAEFRGGNSTEQLAGMDIVMNRVKSDKFPNTIEGVIVQPWQFSSLIRMIIIGFSILILVRRLKSKVENIKVS